MSSKKIAIVGAGPGGLAAGMLLSAQGYHVTIYEKQPHIGGRTSRFQLGEYKFDRGPTFFMMPHILEELFTAARRNLHDYVEMVDLNPLYRLQFGAFHFSPSRNVEQMEAEVERLFPGNGAGYRRYMREEEKKFEAVKPLLQRPFSSVKDYFALDIMKALPRLHVHDSVYNRLSNYFTDERLKFAFTFQAKYLGMSPWECPGTFTILSYMEHKFGLFHPIGGVNQLCEAMAQVIQEYGGRIVLNAGVRRIQVENGRAKGIQLENGESITADHIIVNGDFASAMNQLFEPGLLKKYAPERLAKKKYSCSTFMLYLGINREIRMPHHSILFSGNYQQNVHEMMSEKRLSEDPSIYVHNPCVIDRTLAPSGKTSLYVLMPVPNLTGNVDWEQEKSRVREQMLQRLEQEAEMQDLSQYIEQEQMVTPVDWRDDFGVYEGATFNLAHSMDQMMLLRPHNRFEEVEGVWLVGGGTHPGSGLPTIFESARISTRLLMEQDQTLRFHRGKQQ
ncbi:phytoene desaturase family protein [Paenibacillus assamensis]|uniref:phytoene desaturase family protein n=1 Tax=Paenibacillus assamensis TaxID=311244 RepID=UPI000418ED05|nr:phytoene desaturase family protein [Paenibacillus assamensis]